MNPRVRQFLPALVFGLVCLSAPVAADEDGPFSQFNDRARVIVDDVNQNIVQVVRLQESSDGSAGAIRRLGSGIAYENGHVLTTAGTVGPATEVEIRWRNEFMKARVAGVDHRTNVAVLQVPGLKVKPLEIAENSLLFPGRIVIAVGVGAPGGPEASFGTVIVSDGPNLGLTELDMVQVTAPAYPGLTGGLLVNRDGHAVGLVSGRMKLDRDQAILPEGSNMVSGFFEGGHLTTTDSGHITLAMPITVALELAEEMLRKGIVQRGYLGVQVELVQVGRRHQESYPGVMIHSLVDEGPADDAGLIPGDVILEYAEARVTSPEDLSYLVGATLPGASVPVLYLRRGARSRATLIIDQAPDLPWNPQLDAFSANPPDAGLARVPD